MLFAFVFFFIFFYLFRNCFFIFFFSSRRRHTSCGRDWSSDVCSSDLYRRLSPVVLIGLLEAATKSLAEYHASRDPYAIAPYGVSWAGEQKSPNWFDTAREFTERWHHQQQIRLAVSRSGIMTCELYHPVLDCFLQALPFTYRNVPAKPGTLVGINVVGECGGIWHLYRSEDSWQLIGEPFSRAVCEVTIPQEIAWRICTKGIDTESALAQ